MFLVATYVIENYVIENYLIHNSIDPAVANYIHYRKLLN
jgi:hypothetical protein